MKKYNIKCGTPTTIRTGHEFTTYLFHPYGLSEFREDILKFVKEKKEKGLEYLGHDNLTHAWRTPWDIHVRYGELMSPLNEFVTSMAKELLPNYDWYQQSSWIAEYINCSGANNHHHGDIGYWSYCYYVKVPDEGPGFMLQDGILLDFYDLNVSDGDILFFRSFVGHQVMPSVGERVVISGNLKPLDLEYKFLEKDFSDMDSDDWTHDWNVQGD